MQLFQNFIHEHVLRMREQYETADIDLTFVIFSFDIDFAQRCA